MSRLLNILLGLTALAAICLMVLAVWFILDYIWSALLPLACIVLAGTDIHRFPHRRYYWTE